MKLLVISYSYAPDLTPRAFRWAAIVKELQQAGHTVEVVTAAHDPQTDYQEGTLVHRIPDGLMRVNADAGPNYGTPSAYAPPYAPFKRLLRALWRTFRWPDYAVGWLFPALFFVKKLSKNRQYDWIITVSHPFTSHLVGLLCRRYFPGSKWLLDMGDPFYLQKEPSPNNRFLYGWLSHWIEKNALSAAHAISVTTEPTQILYEKWFPKTIGKITVIPPLLSMPIVHLPSKRDPAAPIRLVFVGTLYKNLRSPVFLLSCFEQLLQTGEFVQSKLELHIYGAINDCASAFQTCPENVRTHIFIHGIVTRQIAWQAMVDADVLLNIGNHSGFQLPSKIIEYMATGKPIVNLISIKDDTSVAAIGEYPALTIRASSDPLPTTQIAQLGAFILNPPHVNSEYSLAIRKTYSADHIAAQYQAMLVN